MCKSVGEQQQEEALIPFADTHDVSIAETALAWIGHQNGVCSTLIGAKNRDQLKSNLNSVNIELTAEDLERLDAVSALPSRFPLWVADFQNQNRFPGDEREV